MNDTMAQVKVVFGGDSITDAGRTGGAIHALGDGYVRLIALEAANQGLPLEIINAGISGNRVRDLRARWDADVLAHNPNVITILIGINDTWRRYDSNDQTSVEDFERSYDDILHSAASLGLDSLIVMEPFLIPVDEHQVRWREEDLEPKIAATRRLAAKYGAVLVGLDAVLNDAASARGAIAIAADGVHPTEQGHFIIARHWWDAIQASVPNLGLRSP